MTLCFIEQLILTLVPSERIGKSWPFVLLPFVLLALSSGLYILYYKKMHPGHLLQSNGPSCYCCEDGEEDFCNLQGLVCLKIRTIGRRKEKSKPPVHGEEMLVMQQGKRNDTELTTRDFDDHQNGSIQNSHAQNRLMLNGSTTNRKLGSRRKTN